jgi:hypothetical protein
LVKFTCPKCYETFSTRKSESAKVKDAASLNEAFGHTCKVSLADLARIFLSRSKLWTRREFHAAIEKKLELHYSHAHANATLKKFKTNAPALVTVDNVCHVAFSGPTVSVITYHPGEDDSKLVHETVVSEPASETKPLIIPPRISKKAKIP